MVFDKMVAISLDFKWLGFWISEPIRNPDHYQTTFFDYLKYRGDLNTELIWYSNGLVFICHLNTEQMDAILFSYVLV